MSPLKLLALVALGMVLILALGQVSAASRNPSGCCLATNDKKIPYKIISTYKHQGLFSGCDIPAIVFTTNKNKHLCAPTDSDWVKKYMVCLDQKLKIC
ncbi:C-C motif chemokine 21a-like isoform X2 [Aquarana catesbeiana]|uniref:C-C motif chemokine 21a-like isoform X2 n=1 Tax=Aquarana catesbeiana TaxID=8400 RepID=UPI003CC97E51